VDASTFRFGAVTESAPHNRNNYAPVSRCSTEFSDVGCASDCISSTRLCLYINAAESKVERALGKHTFAKAVKKRRSSTTPPEEMGAVVSVDPSSYPAQHDPDLLQDSQLAHRSAIASNSYGDAFFAILVASDLFFMICPCQLFWWRSGWGLG